MARIFVCHHKPYWVYQDDIFTPIEVGAALRGNHLPMISDDMGKESISNKNASFCELTAMYWAWRHVRSDVVGFCHYRRYFSFYPDMVGPIVQKPFSVSLMPDRKQETIARYGIADKELLAQWLERYEVIVPQPVESSLSMEKQYCLYHREEDWRLLLQTMERVDPGSRRWIERVFQGVWPTYPYNMFIMKGELFAAYMEWLFEILFALERVLIPSEDAYQKRVFGFMAERLFTLYLARLQATSPIRVGHAHIVMPGWE